MGNDRGEKNLLSDVLTSSTDATDCEEYIVMQEIASQHLDFSRECSREHEGDSLASWRHGVLLHNAPDLRLKSPTHNDIELESQRARVIANSKRWPSNKTVSGEWTIHCHTQ